MRSASIVAKVCSMGTVLFIYSILGMGGAGCSPVHEGFIYHEEPDAQKTRTSGKPQKEKEENTAEKLKKGRLHCSLGYDVKTRRLHVTISNTTSKTLAMLRLNVNLYYIASNQKRAIRVEPRRLGSGDGPALLLYTKRLNAKRDDLDYLTPEELAKKEDKRTARLYFGSKRYNSFGSVWLAPDTQCKFILDDIPSKHMIKWKGERKMKVWVETEGSPASIKDGMAWFPRSNQIKATSDRLVLFVTDRDGAVRVGKPEEKK